MKKNFRIVIICLGSSPNQFEWEHHEKSKKYQKVENISTLYFYEWNLIKVWLSQTSISIPKFALLVILVLLMPPEKRTELTALAML